MITVVSSFFLHRDFSIKAGHGQAVAVPKQTPVSH